MYILRVFDCCIHFYRTQGKNNPAITGNIISPITQPPKEVPSPDTLKVSQEGNTQDNIDEDKVGLNMQGSDATEGNIKDNVEEDTAVESAGK